MLLATAQNSTVTWHQSDKGLRRSYLVPNTSSAYDALSDWLNSENTSSQSGFQFIDDSYYDTEDLSLFSAGFVCVLRAIQGNVAVCIIPVDALAMRQSEKEYVFQEIAFPEIESAIDIHSLPEGQVSQFLRDNVSATRITRFARVQTRRHHYHLVRSAPLLAFLDEVCTSLYRQNVVQGTKNEYRELSLLENDGNADAMAETLGDLAAITPLWPASSTALRRALESQDLMRDYYLQRKNTEKRVIETADDLLREHMRTQLNDLRYWEAIAIEDTDEEGVHQMRVAIRRIRAALKTFAPILSTSDTQHWHTEFRWLGKRLGAVRDLDVFSDWLHTLKCQGEESAVQHFQSYQADITALRDHARLGMLEGMRSERYKSLLANFANWIEQERILFLNKPLAWRPLSELADELIEREIRRGYKKIRKIHRGCDQEQLHSFRIECKRLRYTLDMLKVASKKSYKSLIKATKQVQEVLGDHQDACETANRLERYASGDAAHRHGDAFVFFVGGLHATQLPVITTNRNAFFLLQDDLCKALKTALKS